MQDNQRQTDWAYVAGILDADGCFMISKHNRKRFSPTYLPCVKIAMVEEEAIKFLTHELRCGKYGLDRARKDRFKSKPIFHWYMRSKKEIVPFLDKIIPYLKVKKDRARFLKEYCLSIQNCKAPTYGLVESELDYRELSYVKMRKFNGNEVAATTKSRRHVSASDSLNS